VPGGGLLVVARDVEETRALARSARRIFVLGFGLLSIVGLAGAVLVARNMTRRIDAVTGASRRIMQGALAERLPLEGSGDEIDRLSASVNEMLERIEQLMAGLREVSDNIAHDLKTPLTRLRSRAETALREAHGEARLREGLERVIEDADGIIKTFNALLSIARLEAGAGAERRERVDLCEVLRDAAELYEPVAEEAGLAIRLAGEAGIVARADRQLIGQAVANLIDNAIKHGADEVGHVGASAASGKRDAERHTIVVALSLREGLAEIAVADRGPGIPAADRERALKRFVRLEASRTRPGTGLGLSLVAAVARQHGGTVRLEDNHPGLRVVLSLPAEAAPPAKPLERDAAAQTMPAAPARRPELTVGTDS
jgi:signal transduction histidine kinase